MKNTIKKILTEETNLKKDKFDKYIISTLVKEGFTPSSDYLKIIKFLNHNFGIVGMEAFELYQLFKDNYKNREEDELYRSNTKMKSIRTANINARDLVMNKIPFKGSNTNAQYIGDVYVVYSYDWYPIFVNKDGQWFENNNKYSRSTSKQMSQLRPRNQGEIILLSKSELNDVIYR
jgi:hypothetical protein